MTERTLYSLDQQRVADFLFERGMGGGDDPIGFILASYEFLVMQRRELIGDLEKLAERADEIQRGGIPNERTRQRDGS